MISDCQAKLGRRALVGGLLAAPAVIRSARSGVIASSSDPLHLPMPAPMAMPAPALPAAAAPGPAGLLPRWRRFAVPAPATDGRPAITIVVDDMGVMHANTQRALALPGPLTLSWFPFARNLPDQVAAGAERGHEATLHMPMQAFGNSIAWTGPDPLRVDISLAENQRRLCAALDAVPDTVGLNNHMGSVATRDVALMSLVAAETRKRDMLFLDSLTIPHSVAYRQAAAAGVPAASRDIFIDYQEHRDIIAGQLALIEHTARSKGHVIAIGHPRALTLDALEAWLPGLQNKGFVLWPLSATVAWRNEVVNPSLS